MDPPKGQQKNADIEAEMIEDIETFRNENQYLKSQRDRLQKLLDQITCSNDSQRMCQCGNKLRYLSTEMNQSKKDCSKCGKKVASVSRVWWACQLCNYYTCSHCEGYKKSVCPFSHFLEFRKVNLDIQKQELNQQQAIQQINNAERKKSKTIRQCDICLHQITGNYYACTCGFDMCEVCRNK